MVSRRCLGGFAGNWWIGTAHLAAGGAPAGSVGLKTRQLSKISPSAHTMSNREPRAARSFVQALSFALPLKFQSLRFQAVVFDDLSMIEAV